MKELLDALAAGDSVNERDFDLMFPREARKFSRMHWTPVAVAVKAAQWLASRPGARVLDVGAGSGKVCMIGAVTTGASFVGVERDPEMVAVAKQVTKENKIERVRYVCEDVLAHDWAQYDGVYLFNPFANHVENEAEFISTVREVGEKLKAMPVGTRVVTFHGFGGTMPEGYVQLEAEIIGPGVLQLWEKR